MYGIARNAAAGERRCVPRALVRLPAGERGVLGRVVVDELTVGEAVMVLRGAASGRP
ncbi:hypothetical protein [Streptomyces canus]|uniref:hypothetical protein n=1 Tax=Streptomyces canus TaxID=58343 RepID=UPI00386BA75D